MWKGFWRRFRPGDETEEDTVGLRELFLRSAFRVAAIFAMLFGFVFLAFWWSGSAVRFSVDRAANRVEPTWKVTGTVRNATTHQGIPWARVEDDPEGRPPQYQTDAGLAGDYELLTLAEPHRIRISAPGYRSAMINVGRAWFVWLPRGVEKRDIELLPD